MKTTNGYRTMKRIYTWLFSIAICFGIQQVEAQSCFVQLDDATGLKFEAEDSLRLDSFASVFKNILPSGSQGSFKVFTAGVYWHAPSYEGFNEYLDGILEDAITTYSGQYYVAFFVVKGLGNSTDWRVVTRMNLPSEVYECTEAYYNVLLNSLLQMNFSIEPKDGAVPYAALAGQITTVIPKIGDVVDHMLNCCNGLRSECAISMDPDQLLFLMATNGFYGLRLDSINYTSGDTINHLFMKGDDFEVIRDGLTINLVSDLGPFLNDFNGVLPNYGANLLFYDESNLDELISLVANNDNSNPSITDNTDNRMVNSTYSSNGIFNFDIVGVKILDLNFLFVRKRETIFSSNPTAKGKIYIIKVGINSGVDFSVVKSAAEYYMQWTRLNVPVVLKLSGIDTSQINSKDALVLIGDKKSKIVEFVKSQYCDTYKTFFSDMDKWVQDDREIKAFLQNTDNEYVDLYPETSSENISVIYSGPVFALSKWKTSSIEEAIGFIILHTMGHNAKFKHLDGGINDPSWIMSHANEIFQALGTADYGNYKYPYYDLIEFITKSGDDNKEYWKPKIIKDIKTRFEID